MRTWSSNSLGSVPTKRSAKAFMSGARIAVRTTRTPDDLNTPAKRDPSFVSWSQMTTCGASSMVAFLACCAHHSSVGAYVTAAWRIVRRRRSRKKSTNTSRNRMSNVCTKSHAHVTWFRRNVDQLWPSVPCSGSRGRLPSRGPHGSGRAEFPHPALRDTDSLRGGIGPQDACPREWIALPQLPHAVPRHACPLRAATEPLAPDAHDLFAEVFEGFEVPGDPVVPEVPSQLLRERLLLLLDRVVPMESAPLGDSLERPAQTVAGRLPLHHPLTLAG